MKKINIFEDNSLRVSNLQKIIGGRDVRTVIRGTKDIWHDNNDNNVFDSGDCIEVNGNG